MAGPLKNNFFAAYPFVTSWIRTGSWWSTTDAVAVWSQAQASTKIYKGKIGCSLFSFYLPLLNLSLLHIFFLYLSFSLPFLPSLCYYLLCFIWWKLVPIMCKKRKLLVNGNPRNVILKICEFSLHKLWSRHHQWLVDIALRLLCVLSLDKFGDFVSDQVRWWFNKSEDKYKLSLKRWKNWT